MVSHSKRRLTAIAGGGVLAASGIGLAAAGPELVAAATWSGERGGPVPGWLLGVFGSGLGLGGQGFYALLWVAFAGYLLLIVGAATVTRAHMWWLVAALVTLFALAPPLLSQDVFSYIAYARIGTEYGLNPYETTPIAIHGDPVMNYVGWPDVVSAYGPVFTFFSYIFGPLTLSASLWLHKVAAAGAVLGIAAICERLAIWRGVNPRFAVAFVALNPLTLVHVVGGAHNDALVALALTGACALALSSRPVTGGALIAVAAATKVSALFAAPFMLIGALRGGSRTDPRKAFRFLAGAAAAATGIGLIAWATFGASVFESLVLIDQNQSATTRYSIPATMSRIFDVDPDAVRLAAVVTFAAVTGWLIWRVWCGADWVWAAAWCGFAMLIASGWLLPWYLIWVLPLVAISRDRVLIAAMLALTAFQLISRVPL